MQQCSSILMRAFHFCVALTTLRQRLLEANVFCSSIAGAGVSGAYLGYVRVCFITGGHVRGNTGAVESTLSSESTFLFPVYIGLFPRRRQ